MRTDKVFRPWRLDWPAEQIGRFWDWWESSPALLKHYFPKRNGQAVLDQISRYVRFSGTIDGALPPAHNFLTEVARVLFSALMEMLELVFYCFRLGRLVNGSPNLTIFL